MEQAWEYAGVASGLIYLYLEIRQRRAMWVVGFITSAVYVIVFFRAKIYADAGLNLYYTAISLYGFWQWSRTRKKTAPTAAKGLTPESLLGANTESSATGGLIEAEAEPPNTENPVDSAVPILYRHWNARLALGILLALAVLGGTIYFVLAKYTDSPVPAGDAFTTAIGIVATWMLARRILEHWWLWIVADLVSIYLYYVRELYPTMFLYFCYTLLAVAGLYTWKKKGVNVYDTTL